RVFIRAGNAASQTTRADRHRSSLTGAPPRCGAADAAPRTPMNAPSVNPLLLRRLSGGERFLDRFDGDVRAPLDDLLAERDRFLFRDDADAVDGRLVTGDSLRQSNRFRIVGHQ